MTLPELAELLDHVSCVLELREQFRETLDYTTRRECEHQEMLLKVKVERLRAELNAHLVLQSNSPHLFAEGGAL